jgi:tetratricopeptide (TPR) repeat protein
MKPRFGWSFFILLTVFACQQSALAVSDYMARLGEKYYKAGSYENAANSFQTALKDHPGSAYLHYMRANALMMLKRNVEAADEYVQASSLDPLGQVGKYSQHALGVLSQTGTGDKPRRSATATAPGGDPGRSTSASSEPVQSDLERQITAERDTKIAQINKETQDKIWQLEREKNDRIASNGEKAYRMVTVGYGPTGPINQPYAYYDPSDANDQITRDYSLKEDIARGESERRIADTRSFYAQKLAGIKH